MKTKNIKLLFIAIASIAVVSCEKNYDTDGISKITYYADFAMTGDPVMVLPIGSTYTEPGVVATEAGANLTVDISYYGDFFSGPVSGVDGSVPDKYVITYAATNSDGFDGTTTRDVYVVNTGDLVNSIEGLYSSTVIRNEVESPQYQNMEYVMIIKTGTNKYTITDAIGGYYDIGRAYGAGFRASGLEITANNIAANDFSFNDPITIGSWTEALTITSMEVNATNKTITLISDWAAGYTFEVILTQVEP